MIVAGIGCRSRVHPDAVVALVRRAVALGGAAPVLLAIPWFRDGDASLRKAAGHLSLPLRVVDRDALLAAQPRCRSRSDAALRAHGIAAVAEGCALAAGGAAAVLVVPRLAGGGVTCALSRSEGPA